VDRNVAVLGEKHLRDDDDRAGRLLIVERDRRRLRTLLVAFIPGCRRATGGRQKRTAAADFRRVR
jgi:hypothetical protein